MDLAQRHHRYRPWTFEAVRALFAGRGCTLLEQEYVGTRQVMRYVCPAGHEYAQRFDHFVGGHGCPRCRSERRWEGRRIDLDDVLLAVEDEGYTDVEVVRENGRIRLSYTCTAGHRAQTTHSHFIEGKRCRTCACARFRGAGSPNFNPSLTPEERIAKRNFEAYAEWRRGVYARDGHACRRCGAHGRLNAHHIVNYSTVRDLRTVLSNGITFCVGCHRAFHVEYGRHDNNAEQLRRFMGASWV